MTRSCGTELASALQVCRHRLVASIPNGTQLIVENSVPKNQLLANQRGLPLETQLSGTQVHDSRLFIPLVASILAVNGLWDMRPTPREAAR